MMWKENDVGDRSTPVDELPQAREFARLLSNFQSF